MFLIGVPSIDANLYLYRYFGKFHNCREYFGISDDFPMTHLLVRSKETDKRRKMYITNQFMSNIIKNNEDRLKVTYLNHFISNSYIVINNYAIILTLFSLTISIIVLT